MIYNELKMKSFFHILPKVNPGLDIIKGRRCHGLILKNNFAQLHKLIDLNRLVVVIVQLETDISDVLDIPKLISVEVV